MKIQRFNLLILMFGLGILFGVLLIGYGSRPDPEMVRVVVAAKDLQAGTLLVRPEESLTVALFPRGAQPKDGFSEVHELRNKVLERNFDKGQPCTGKALFTVLQKGCEGWCPRTISVRAVDLGIFKKLPGRRVEISGPFPDRDGKIIKCTLLKDAPVWAVAESSKTDPDDPVRKLFAVTFGVPSDEISRVAWFLETRSSWILSLSSAKSGDGTTIHTMKWGIENLGISSNK